MLEQYLFWLGATNSRKSKRRRDKAVASSQASKERAFHFHVSEKLLHRFPKIQFTIRLQAQPCS